MSYALQNRVFASGKATLTVAGGAGLTNVTVAVTGILKASDVVLITLDRNSEANIAVNALPYVYQVTNLVSFSGALLIENSGVADATCFLNWAVLR